MDSSSNSASNQTSKIPIEYVSEKEMAEIEAVLAATSGPASPSAHLQMNSRSIRSITLLSKRGLSACSSSFDIEDSAKVVGSDTNSPQTIKKFRVLESFLHRFRRRRGLSVTDITATEWCEKQMEFTLRLGRPKRTKAMKAGSARHAALEEEVIQRVKVNVKSAEDVWALKLINFIVGANQLLFDGLTRELPLVGFVEGIWMVGIIDELRMPASESERYPTIVDTKTRVQPTLPHESQKRNGRLQLMCYKYMWDSLVGQKFPWHKFYDFFSLNPHQVLSPEIRESTAESGFPSATLTEVGRYFGNCCRLLPPAHEQLLLRYELQKDQSLLGEDEFAYDRDWLNEQIKSCLDFWLGKREANYAPMEDRWKCGYCQYGNVCRANSRSPNKTESNQDTRSLELP